MWVKQCHLHHPPVITSNRNFYRWYKPFPNGYIIITINELSPSTFGVYYTILYFTTLY